MSRNKLIFLRPKDHKKVQFLLRISSTTKCNQRLYVYDDGAVRSAHFYGTFQ